MRKPILGLVAVVAALPLVVFVGSGAASSVTPATSCLSGGTVDIDWQYAHENPSYGTGAYAPDGCWSWNDFASESGTWGICSWNGGDGYFRGSEGDIVYDDTDVHHTGGVYGSENGLIDDYCLGGSGHLDVEEEAPDSSCPTTRDYVARDTGFTVGVFLKEIYCGENSARDFGMGTCSSPNAEHGCMMNAGADVPETWGGGCSSSVSTCESHLQTDFQHACSNYGDGDTLGVFGGYAIDSSDRTTIADWINADVNAYCFVALP